MLRPELEKDFSFGIQSLKDKLADISYLKTQEHIEEYIETEKNKAKTTFYKQVEIGMNKDEVSNLMGPPAFIENKYVNNEIKQLWFYFDDIEQKYISLYFENNIMMRIDD